MGTPNEIMGHKSLAIGGGGVRTPTDLAQCSSPTISATWVGLEKVEKV